MMRTNLKFLLNSTITAIALTMPASAAVIADFVDDFPSVNGSGPGFDGTEVPSTGWDYMWNPDGVLGVSANYQSLVPNSVSTDPVTGSGGLFTNVGDSAFNNSAQGDFQFGRIGVGSSHPGKASTGNDFRAIFAYTIQSGEAGTVAITNSSLIAVNGSGDGNVLDVYVNDTIVGGLSVGLYNDTGTPTSFNGSLGNLSAGDVVYVTVGYGPNGSSAGDAFAIDFSLDVIPEPGSSALLCFAGLLFAVRRRR